MGRSDFARISQAIEFLDVHVGAQPSLDAVAQHVGLSPSHLQRLFRGMTGLSPKRFLQFATAAYVRGLLSESKPLLEASLLAGLSSPSRLHEVVVHADAVSPGALRRRGAGVRVRFGVHASPLGAALVARTGRGLCALSFSEAPETAVAELHARWPLASFEEDVAATRAVIDWMFGPTPRPSPLQLHLSGTNFQLRVWEALLRIPDGAVASYGDVARALGLPAGAARAVGTAIGANPVAVLIPCHRVLRDTGAFGGYRWGLSRKRTLLAWEAARLRDPASPPASSEN